MFRPFANTVIDTLRRIAPIRNIAPLRRIHANAPY